LGITQATVSVAKKRGNFPAKWAHKIALKYGSDTEFILTGKGRSSADKAQTGEQIIKDKAQHSDTSTTLDNFLEGTGMYTIGDFVRYIFEHGNEQDRIDLMFAKKQFVDWTSQRMGEIKSRDESKKNKAC
jgi:hypothetical protein